MESRKRRTFGPFESVMLDELDADNKTLQALASPGVNAASEQRVRLNTRNGLRTHTIAFFRSLRLHIIGQFGLLGRQELPKIAVDIGWIRLLPYLFIHIPPLGAAITLIALNTSNYFVGQDFESRTILQFISKLLEVWIQSSMTAILLSHVNKQINEDYTAFGALFAPKHTTHITFLWSLEFWGLLLSPDLRRRSKLISAGLIFSIVLLAAVAGPSSATLMIPRQVVRIFHDYTQLYLDDTPSTLFPQEIKLIYKPEMSGEYITSLATADVVYGDGWGWGSHITDEIGSRYLNVSGLLEYESRAEISSFLPLRGISKTLISRFPDSYSGMSRLPYGSSITTLAFQPLVSVSCLSNLWDRRPTNSTIITVPTVGSYPFKTFLELLFANQMDHDTTRNLTYWAYPPSHGNVPALGFRIFLKINGETVSYDDETLRDALMSPTQTPWVRTTFWIVACSVGATWELAEYEVRTAFNGPVVQSRPVCAGGFQYAKHIRFDLAWLRQVERRLKNHLSLVEYDPWNVRTENAIAAIMAASIANGLADIHPEWHSPRSKAICDEYATNGSDCQPEPFYPKDYDCPLQFDIANDNCSILQADLYQAGYGYDTSELTVKLSLAVLGAYCFLVILYLSISCFVWKSECMAWNTPAELVTLASQSRYPEHLGSTSVGINTLKTFKEPVSVGVNEQNLARIGLRERYSSHATH